MLFKFFAPICSADLTWMTNNARSSGMQHFALRLVKTGCFVLDYIGCAKYQTTDGYANTYMQIYTYVNMHIIYVYYKCVHVYADSRLGFACV